MRELSIDAAGPGTPLPKFWQALGCDHLYHFAKWTALISAFTEHLLARYGEDEVLSWYFECYNEPDRMPGWVHNLLYDHFVAAVTRVHPRLRVGGPAMWTAALGQFLEHVGRGCDQVSGGPVRIDPDLILYWGFAYEASRGTFLGSVLTAGPVLKPIWAVYEMLARLGDERLDLGGAGASDRVAGLATRDACGSLRVLLYHFAEGPEPAGAAEEVRVRLDGHGALRADEASWYLLDGEHGNTFRAWEAMGRPPRLAPEQLAELRSLEQPQRHAGGIAVEPEGDRCRLTLCLPAQSVSLLEIPAAA